MGLYAKQISCTAAILNLQTSKNPNFLEGHISNYFMHGFLRNLKISANRKASWNIKSWF